jgi:hypothetical protein
MEFIIPIPMKLEHDELHAELFKETKEGGKIGEAAKVIAGVLHSHFVKEEEYAIPPLAILRQLADGQVKDEMREVFPMTDKLKQNLPHMLEEYMSIVAALKTLIELAQKENKPEYIRFANK